MFGFTNADARAKPPWGAEVDRAHPLFPGLTNYFLFHEGTGQPFDLVGGLTTTATGSAPNYGPTWQPGDDGPVRRYGAGDYDTAAGFATPPGAFSIAGTLRPTTVDGQWHAALYQQSGGNRPLWLGLSGGSASTANSLVLILNAGTTNTAYSATTLAAGRTYRFVATYDGVSGVSIPKLYLDGVLGPNNNNASRDAGVTGLNFGRDTTNNFQWYGDLGGFPFWNRALTAGEAQAWTADPHGLILAPTTRRFFVPTAGGGGGGTLAAGASASSVATLAATPTLKLQAASSASSVATLAAAPTLALAASASASSTATLAGTATLSLLASASASSTATATAGATLALLASAAPSSTATLTAAPTLALQAASSASSVATLGATPTVGTALAAAASATSTATLAATPTLALRATAGASSVATLGAAPTLALLASASATSVATLSAGAAHPLAASASASSVATLSAGASATAAPTADPFGGTFTSIASAVGAFGGPFATIALALDAFGAVDPRLSRRLD